MCASSTRRVRIALSQPQQRPQRSPITGPVHKHTLSSCVCKEKKKEGCTTGSSTPHHSTAHTRERQTRLGSARLGSRASCLILLPLQFCHHPQQQQQQHWQSGRKSCARSWRNKIKWKKGETNCFKRKTASSSDCVGRRHCTTSTRWPSSFSPPS